MAGRALIVVDVQKGFTSLGALASPRCLDAVPRIAAIARDRRDAGAGLIFTADTHTPDDAEFLVFPPHCVRGTEEAEIVDELQPLLDGATVVPKRRYSAFHGTDLERILAADRPDEVEVVGVCTDICVLHTVADLRNRDYPVRVLTDGVATFDGPGHSGDEVDAWALAHIERILGASVGPA